MERKYLIIIILLSVGFLAGGLVLTWQRGLVGFAGADVSRIFSNRRQWVEIKPRVASPTSTFEAGTSAEIAGNDKIKTADTDAKIKKSPVEAAPLAVRWCSPKSGVSPQRKAVVNEVAWMGSLVSYSNEWIEIKNIFDQSISLDGWQLQNKSQKIKVVFDSGAFLIPGGGFIYWKEPMTNRSLGSPPTRFIPAVWGTRMKRCIFLTRIAGCTIRWLRRPNGRPGITRPRKPWRAGSLLWQTSAVPGGTPKAENK